MELDKAAIDRHAGAIKQLALEPGPTMEGDTLKVNYKFYIHYFGNIDRCLRAVTEIARDPAIVVSADLKELNDGECIIADCIKALNELQQTLKARKR